MAVPYAELIGDPVAHSKSPLIHKFWLKKLGLCGDYRTKQLSQGTVADYLDERCADGDWRGCNVTSPLKAHAAEIALDPLGVCARLGAANAIFRSPLGCGIAANTDVEGVREALADTESLGNQVCVIGAGGAARAALEFLRLRNTLEVSLVVRDVQKARLVHRAFTSSGGVYSFEQCDQALAGAEWIVNATPLGMEGMPPMPDKLLACLDETEDCALVFDMVYSPVETVLLKRARELGRKTSDGFTMLIGQAAPAFELFFGAAAPRQYDAELRELLTA